MNLFFMAGQNETFVKLEGFVSFCIYDNAISRDFPEPCISFEIGEDFERLRCLISGRNRPPLLNGQYVSGRGFYRELVEQKGGRALIVDALTIFDSKGGRMLAHYSL